MADYSCCMSPCFRISNENEQKEGAAAREGGGPDVLVLLLACLFTAAFPRQRFLDALFLAGLQVEGVTLNLLDNIFLLHLTLEATQRILKRFSLLNSDFCQTDYTPKLVPFGPA